MHISKFRAVQPDIQLTDDDMMHIMNDWRNNPEIYGERGNANITSIQKYILTE